MFQILVIDNDTDKRVKTDTVTVTYDKAAEDFVFCVNDEPVTDTTYTLPKNTNTLDLSCKLTPYDATGVPSGSSPTGVTTDFYYDWYSEDTSVGTVDQNGHFTAVGPGKTSITATMMYGDMPVGGHSIEIIVPIAGFTLKEPNPVYGADQNTLAPQFESVWCYGGKPITTGLENYLTVSKMNICNNNFDSIAADYTSGMTIDYDITYYYQYYITPAGDNTFNMTENMADSGIWWGDGGGDYVVDVTALEMDTLYSDEVSSAPGRGYMAECYDTDYATSLVYNVAHKPLLNPDCEYIDTIITSQRTPAVGETAYQGDVPFEDTQTAMTFLDGQIDTLSGTLTQTGEPLLMYTSGVYQINTLTGSGVPYDAVPDSELSSDKNVGFYCDTILWAGSTPEYREENGLTEQFYTEGIYANDLSVKLQSDGAAENGTVYRISPDAKLYVNGKLMEAETYDYGTAIRTAYYFDVGDVQTYDSAQMQGIGSPVGGQTPATAEDAVFTDAYGNELPIYASRLTWFVDANSNNVLDAGEEATVRYDGDGNYDPASYLTEDGKFKCETAYKVYAELAIAENASGCPFSDRGFTTKLVLNGTPEDMINAYVNGTPSGIYEFSPTEMPVGQMHGDVNNDNQVNATDALWVLQHTVDLRKLTETELEAADVTDLGKVDTKDALQILQKTVELIDQFDVEK